MFELFKKRDFSDYINDSFGFFKVEGKNYFKNYLLINGGILVVMLLLSYFVFQLYFKSLFSGTTSHSIENDYFSQYLSDHGPIILLLFAVFFILFLVASSISYAFPSLYLKNMEKTPSQPVSSQVILSDLKKESGRILLFLLAFTFTIFPLIAIAVLISFALVFVLIGIPLLMILIPAIMSCTCLAFNEYLIRKTSFFDSFGYAVKLLKANFWPIVGSTMLIYLIIQIVITLFSTVPQIVFLVKTFTVDQTIGSGFMAQFGLVYLITTLATVLLSFVLNNLLLVNQSLIYYSEREKLENNRNRFDLELLGKTDE